VRLVDLSPPERVLAQKLLKQAKRLIDDGGFVPMLDHSAPPDIPYDNYCYFMDRLAKAL